MTRDQKEERERSHLLAGLLRRIGKATAPDTRTGRIFVAFEKRMTKFTHALVTNDTFLYLSGNAMRAEFQRHAATRRTMERLLKLWNLPTASDMVELKNQLRQLNNQVERLSEQLDSIEKEKEKASF